jgi:hypothetical protein
MPKAVELSVPPDAHEKGGTEVLRCFVVDGGLSISFTAAFKDPGMWGMLLVDVARHAARAYEREGVMTSEQSLDAIKQLFDAEWDRPSDPGSTDTVN